MLLSLETIHKCLWEVNADDAAMRATVSLRLAILQADFAGDYRKACQVRISRRAAVWFRDVNQVSGLVIHRAAAGFY